MNIAIIVRAVVVVLCAVTLYGCYLAFNRLQTRAETTYGRQRWVAISLAGGIGLIALLTFWCYFAFSAGLLQAMGLNG